jgi:hypothetical protein
MFAVLHATAIVIANLFKSRRRLEAENVLLRHQLSIALRRRAPPRLRLSGMDRAILAWMVRLWPDLIGTVQVVKPETILRWYRAGFRAFWRWKSRKRAGRPKIDRGLRDLVRRMSLENPLWGVSRIHGELLMLGFKVAQSIVSKYMVRGRRPPSQSWRTFLRNHAAAFAAIDMCVVQTVTFDRLFAFLVLGHGRRQLLWFEVTQHPTAEWLARQITEAFPWGSAPEYLVRDNDQAYGQSDGYPRPADQSRGALADGIAELLIGTLRRECLDQLIVFGESHLRRILAAYADYYNQARPHLALQKDAPLKRAVQPIGSSSSRRAASSICPDIIFGKDSSLYRSQHELSRRAMHPTLITSSSAKTVAGDRMFGPIQALLAWAPTRAKACGTTPLSSRLPCWKTRCST